MSALERKAEMIAKAVKSRYGDFFKWSAPEVRSALVRSEAWIILTAMDDSTISSESVGRLVDAELKAEEILNKLYK